MNYASLDIEYDETWPEMCKIRPELGDKVLCCDLDVHSGEVVEIVPDNLNAPRHFLYVIRLDNGDVDEFAEEDVLKRKTGAAA